MTCRRSSQWLARGDSARLDAPRGRAPRVSAKRCGGWNRGSACAFCIARPAASPRPTPGVGWRTARRGAGGSGVRARRGRQRRRSADGRVAPQRARERGAYGAAENPPALPGRASEDHGRRDDAGELHRHPRRRLRRRRALRGAAGARHDRSSPGPATAAFRGRGERGLPRPARPAGAPARPRRPRLPAWPVRLGAPVSLGVPARRRGASPRPHGSAARASRRRLRSRGAVGDRGGGDCLSVRGLAGAAFHQRRLDPDPAGLVAGLLRPLPLLLRSQARAAAAARVPRLPAIPGGALARRGLSIPRS